MSLITYHFQLTPKAVFHLKCLRKHDYLKSILIDPSLFSERVQANALNEIPKVSRKVIKSSRHGNHRFDTR